jgi:hypothetical protein
MKWRNVRGEISVFGLCFVSREIECSSAILSLTEFSQEKHVHILKCPLQYFLANYYTNGFLLYVSD